jgi:ubiquinone/menaquinone biosynthesis C-methylase UbiE
MQKLRFPRALWQPYERVYKEYLEERKHFVSFLNIQPGSVVGDAACGDAGVGLSIAEMSPSTDTLCIDLDENHLIKAARMARSLSISSKLHFLKCDLSTPPLMRKIFDIVILYCSTGCLRPCMRNSIIANIHEMLKDDGQFAIAEFAKVTKNSQRNFLKLMSLYSTRDGLLTAFHFCSFDELKHILLRSGFHIMKTSRIGAKREFSSDIIKFTLEYQKRTAKSKRAKYVSEAAKELQVDIKKYGIETPPRYYVICSKGDRVER